MKSDYPAKLLLAAAKRTNADWCADAVKMCPGTGPTHEERKGNRCGRGTEALLVRLGARRA